MLGRRMLADQVSDDWKPLPSTPAGNWYRLATDLVVAVPRPGFRQSVEDAERSLEALDQIARQARCKQAVIVLVDRVVSQDAAARRVWSTPRANETRCAQALVCQTVLARAIGSFFLGLNRAAVPTRMFATLDAAKAWATAMAKEHGGEL